MISQNRVIGLTTVEIDETVPLVDAMAMVLTADPAEILERADVGLLLDVANVYANCRNHGGDPVAYLERLPLERLAYVHVAGGSEREGLYHDTHTCTTPVAVLEILEELCARVVVPGVLLMLSAGVSTGMLTEQAAAGAEVGQLLPGAAVVTVLASTWLPVSGLFTVTVPVIVTVPPTGMLPVQMTAVPVMVIVPELAV